MRDRKKRVEIFSLYDRTGIEAHLEKMARKGWELEKITTFLWWYRRTEPKKTTFTVTHYPRASAYDPAPTEGELTFREFCARAGWRLAAASAQLQVFCNEEDTPVPIETDPALQVETIHKAMKKTFLPSYGLLLLVGLLNGALFCTRLWGDPVGTLGSNASLLTCLSFAVLIILCLTEIISYFVWYGRAKTAAALDGSFVKTRGHYLLQRTMLVVMLLGLASWLFSLGSGRERFFAAASVLCMTAIFGLVFGIRAFLRRKNVARGTARTVTVAAAFVLSFVMTGGMVFYALQAVGDGWMDERASETYEYRGQTWRVYHDELPLTIEDLMDVSYDGYSYELRTEASLFLTVYDATQRPRIDALGQPYLDYRIIKIGNSVVYDFCLGGLLRKYTGEQGIDLDRRLVAEDPALWGAECVFRVYYGDTPLNRYLVCWPGRIGEISADWALTPEQIAVAAEKIQAA